MPRIHSLHTTNFPYPFFNAIQAKAKTIEVRYLSDDISKIRVGHIIKFINGREIAECKVRAVRKYHTYEQLLTTEKLESVVPGQKDVDAALKIYRTFPCFQLATENGPPKVAAFEIRFIQTKLAKPRMPPHHSKKHKKQDRPHLDDHKAKSSYIEKHNYSL